MSSYVDYAQSAAAYDRFRSPLGLEVMAGYLIAGCSTSARIVDIGCGPGHYVLPLAELISEGSFVGVDSSPDQIRQAQDGLAVAGCKNVELQVADARALPFPSDSFDAVLINMVLHHVPEADRAGALAEIARIVMPGGLVIAGYVSEAQAADGAWYYELAPQIPVRFQNRVKNSCPEEGLSRLGFHLVDRVVPHVGVFRPSTYFDAAALLSDDCRRSSSVFSLLNDDETEGFLRELKRQEDAGTLQALVDRHEGRRRQVGQLTIDIYRSSPSL